MVSSLFCHFSLMLVLSTATTIPNSVHVERGGRREWRGWEERAVLYAARKCTCTYVLQSVSCARARDSACALEVSAALQAVRRRRVLL